MDINEKRFNSDDTEYRKEVLQQLVIETKEQITTCKGIHRKKDLEYWLKNYTEMLKEEK